MKLRLTHNTFLNSALLLFLVLCISYASTGQEIKATAKLDSNSIKIGQQVKLQLSIQYKVNNGKHLKIEWPEITDTIRKEVEVVGQSKLDTLIPDKNDPFQFIQTKPFILLLLTQVIGLFRHLNLG